MDSQPGTSGINTVSFYKTGRKSRPRYVQVPLCTSDTEDIDEYAVDEVGDSYSPHESDEEEYSAAEDDTVVLEVDSSTLASPPQLQSTSKSVRKRKSLQFWTHIRERDEAPTIPIYDILNYNDDDEERISRPIDLFRQFHTDDILNIIVEQSNLYAIQENADKPLDLDRLHWSTAGLGNEKVSSTMSRDRWENIKMKFHLTDNSQIDEHDKWSKVRPLLDHLRSKFKEIPMTEHLCVDEQLVPFKGRSSMKQYIPMKPHNCGYKIFVLADDKGMVYDFIPYTGKIEPVNNPNVPDLNPSSNSVLHLAESIPPFKNHKLYFDNWFTSLPLLDHLASRGIWCCGTVQQTRLHGLTFKSDKQLQGQGRGTYEEWETQYDDKTKITALKWFDNRAVHLASTFATSYPLDKCQRFDRKMKERIEVPRPCIA
ncbi:hypothetical protein Pcinc_014570 [Petrolisthes cinctipes]|uniref:PiggyBac transposable element-derived protein domain-containing protein n=1 Tax=Petrolisthes cinctipes TaxID=88211 RepID=A0AAE1FV10_PETCI|nr:hypothetical protein Pcinc_014570 [Petrolisthes cinctipes]